MSSAKSGESPGAISQSREETLASIEPLERAKSTAESVSILALKASRVFQEDLLVLQDCADVLHSVG